MRATPWIKNKQRHLCRGGSLKHYLICNPAKGCGQKVHGEGNLRQRILDMGILRGTELEMIKKSPPIR